MGEHCKEAVLQLVNQLDETSLRRIYYFLRGWLSTKKVAEADISTKEANHYK